MPKLYTALGTINASRPRKMTVADLRAALEDKDVALRWRVHLRALFEEVPPDAVVSIVTHEGLDPQKLLAIAGEVKPHANAVESRLAELASAA